MRLNHLTAIVQNVQKALVCPKCASRFAGSTVDVVDISGDRGLFSAHCLQCNTSTLVSMSVRDFRQKIMNRERQIQKVTVGKVSPADVVDMKRFLEKFDGDFEKLLKKKPTAKRKKVE